jgi:hypothetical protein
VRQRDRAGHTLVLSCSRQQSRRAIQFPRRRLSRIIIAAKAASDATSALVALAEGFGALQLQSEPSSGGAAGVPASGAPASGGSPHGGPAIRLVQRPIF